MPRRPHPRNVPSRIFEESHSPVFVIDDRYSILYGNPAFAELVGLDREDLNGKSMRFQADSNERISAFCPPVQLQVTPQDGGGKSGGVSGTKVQNGFLQYPVTIEERSYSVRLVRMIGEEDSCWIGHLGPQDAETSTESDIGWLHQLIQVQREKAQRSFGRIPLLGKSPAAKHCFEQAKAFALSDANVMVVGHPGSQAIDIARSICLSGFSESDEQDGILPIDCRAVEGERVPRIIADRLGVESGKGNSRANVLLIQVDRLDQLGQIGLFQLINQNPDRIRLFCTAAVDPVDLDEFHDELALKIGVLALSIPELKNRREDIPLLAQCILEESNALENRVFEFTAEAIDSLQVYPWRNDYCELRQVIEDAIDQCESGRIHLKHFSSDFRIALKAAGNPIRSLESIDLDRFLSDVEAELVGRAVEVSKGNKTRAAKLLGISRARLHRKLDEMDAADTVEGEDGR